MTDTTRAQVVKEDGPRPVSWAASNWHLGVHHFCKMVIIAKGSELALGSASRQRKAGANLSSAPSYRLLQRIKPNKLPSGGH